MGQAMGNRTVQKAQCPKQSGSSQPVYNQDQDDTGETQRLTGPEIWTYFQEVLLEKYSSERNGLNVLTGPIFDHDFDGVKDPTDKIKEYARGRIPIPTHFFIVITSCLDFRQVADLCHGSLNSAAFILPHQPNNDESCNGSDRDSNWVEDLMKIHTARLRPPQVAPGQGLHPASSRVSLVKIMQ
ncbi:autotaxin-like isoform X2 [Stigmatopora nigra]